MVSARATVRTPLWVRAGAAVVLVAVTGWLLAQHFDRIGNQQRLSAIATVIAGRPVRVHCPGVIGRLFSYDLVEGTVQFDADGRPADVAEVRSGACAELDALAEGRRADVLRCVAARPDCGPSAVSLAFAVDVVTHESFHLSGIMDEAITECHALKTMAWTATRLGATPEQARALADLERGTTYLAMPDQYQGGVC
jgi:hypothetical protein